MEEEAFGVLYERYAMGRLLESLARDFGIKNALELPALGAKAMPSMYSYGLAQAGCDLTLVNASPKAHPLWESLGFGEKITYAECDRIDRTELPDDSFDFVWNFATLPSAEDPQALLREMNRVSRKYVCIMSVNRGNVGFPCHRMAHRFSGIPWTHGDIRYNSRHFVRKFMRENGLKVKKWGFVDCPVWPDSLGFRDLRLHRLNVDLNAIDWHSEFFEYGTNGGVPKWIRMVYLLERLPMPGFLKTLYSHLFFVVGEKQAATVLQE